MNRTTNNRPRMAAIYAPSMTCARRWHGDGDVRGYRPPPSWTARTGLTGIHPITSRALQRAVWWIQKSGRGGAAPGASQPSNCHGAALKSSELINVIHRHISKRERNGLISGRTGLPKWACRNNSCRSES